MVCPYRQVVLGSPSRSLAPCSLLALEVVWQEHNIVYPLLYLLTMLFCFRLFGSVFVENDVIGHACHRTDRHGMTDPRNSQSLGVDRNSNAWACQPTQTGARYAETWGPINQRFRVLNLRWWVRQPAPCQLWSARRHQAGELALVDR